MRVPMDLGEASAQVRTCVSDLDHNCPRVSDGSVFMDTDIRRTAMEHQACDKYGMILLMTSSRLRLMNLCVCMLMRAVKNNSRNTRTSS